MKIAHRLMNVSCAADWSHCFGTAPAKGYLIGHSADALKVRGCGCVHYVKKAFIDGCNTTRVKMLAAKRWTPWCNASLRRSLLYHDSTAKHQRSPTMSSDWITSDEEFDEIAEELFDDEQEVASTATTVATPDNQAAGTPLPYVDQEVAEELVGDGPPTWLGMRWREIPEADQPAAWNGLRAWVDWLIKEYRLPTAVVPPCWYKHPDITAELYAGMNMEYKV